MEIRIRYMSELTVSRIDEIAGQKGITRQDFLKDYIEKIASEGEATRYERDYKEMLEKVLYVLQENTELMKLMREEMLLFEKEI